MYVRSRHVGFHVPWPLLLIVGPLWLAVMVMIFACQLIYYTACGLIWLVSAIAAALR